MIGHNYLRSIGNKELRGWNALICETFNLFDELRNVKGYTITDYICNVVIEDPGR